MKNDKGYSTLIIIIVVLVMFVGAIISSLNSDGYGHQSKYSQLSQQEKENAKWAYEVQQAINNR